MPRALLPAVLALVIVIGSAGHSRAQFAPLAQMIPDDANAIVLVDVDKVLSSPLAQRAHWRERREQAFSAGVSFLPPDANKAVLAANLDLETLTHVWEIAALELEQDVTTAKLVEVTGGVADKVGAHEAVVLPGDAFLVRFGGRAVAAISPGNRQTVTRWVQAADARRGVGLSPYLREAYGFVENIGTPVIMAVDLANVVSEAQVRAAFAQAADDPDRLAIDIDKVAPLLAGLRGITLGVTLADNSFAKIKVDFSSNVELTPEVAKQLLLRAIGKRGLMLDEFQEWTPKVSGTQISLEGNLTPSGVRRLSSLFDRPPALTERSLASTEANDAPQRSQEYIRAQATQAYFQQVVTLIEDLKEKPKQSTGTRTAGLFASWFDQFAKKIDKLPTLNVDEEALQFGAFASESLRGAGQALRAGIAKGKKDAREMAVPYNYYNYGATYGYGVRRDFYGNAYGYSPIGAYGTAAVPDTHAYAQMQSKARMQARSDSAGSARGLMEELDRVAGDTRRKLTQKYSIEF